MTTTQTARLETADAIAEFLFAGNATVTLVSEKTGARFTYRVRGSDDGMCHFVSLLSGSDNEGDYQYLGHFRGGYYSHGRKSRIGENAPGAVAFAWFGRHLLAGILPLGLQVWHEGRCGACNRKLTVPSSIAAGLGPECAGKRTFVADAV